MHAKYKDVKSISYGSKVVSKVKVKGQKQYAPLMYIETMQGIKRS